MRWAGKRDMHSGIHGIPTYGGITNDLNCGSY